MTTGDWHWMACPKPSMPATRSARRHGADKRLRRAIYNETVFLALRLGPFSTNLPTSTTASISVARRRASRFTTSTTPLQPQLRSVAGDDAGAGRQAGCPSTCSGLGHGVARQDADWRKKLVELGLQQEPPLAVTDQALKDNFISGASLGSGDHFRAFPSAAEHAT
jgi:hypothetical protein